MFELNKICAADNNYCYSFIDARLVQLYPNTVLKINL